MKKFFFLNSCCPVVFNRETCEATLKTESTTLRLLFVVERVFDGRGVMTLCVVCPRSEKLRSLFLRRVEMIILCCPKFHGSFSERSFVCRVNGKVIWRIFVISVYIPNRPLKVLESEKETDTTSSVLIRPNLYDLYLRMKGNIRSLE